MTQTSKMSIDFVAKVCRPLGLNVIPITGNDANSSPWRFLIIRPRDGRVMPISESNGSAILDCGNSQLFEQYFEDESFPAAGAGLVLQGEGVITGLE